MRTVCIAVLAVLLAVTVGCCFFTVKKKSEYSAAILRLLISGIVAMAGYISSVPTGFWSVCLPMCAYIRMSGYIRRCFGMPFWHVRG